MTAVPAYVSASGYVILVVRAFSLVTLMIVANIVMAWVTDHCDPAGKTTRFTLFQAPLRHGAQRSRARVQESTVSLVEATYYFTMQEDVKREITYSVQ